MLRMTLIPDPDNAGVGSLHQSVALIRPHLYGDGHDKQDNDYNFR